MCPGQVPSPESQGWDFYPCRSQVTVSPNSPPGYTPGDPWSGRGGSIRVQVQNGPVRTFRLKAYLPPPLFSLIGLSIPWALFVAPDPSFRFRERRGVRTGVFAGRSRRDRPVGERPATGPGCDKGES